MSLTSDDVYFADVMREILSGEPCHGVVTEPTRLFGHVFIGSQSNAEDLRTLRRLGVTHVLNCAGYKGPRPTPNASPYEGLGIDYYEFQAEYSDRYDITRHFPEAFRYLDGVKRSGGTVLVHCALGINRSAAVCLAYMMVDRRMPLLAATRVIKDKRRIVLANKMFQRQIVRYARLHGLLDNIKSDGDKRQLLDGRVGGGASWRSMPLEARATDYVMLDAATQRINGLRLVDGGGRSPRDVAVATGNGSRYVVDGAASSSRRYRLASDGDGAGRSEPARLQTGNRSATGYFDTVVVERDRVSRRRDDVTVSKSPRDWMVDGVGGISNGSNGWSMSLMTAGGPDVKYYRSSGSAVNLPRARTPVNHVRSRSTSGVR